MIIKSYECLAEPSEYSQSVQDMIKRVIGDHEWVNREITQEHFPMNGRVLGVKDCIQFWLAIFNGEILSSDEILDELDGENLLPARLKDLLIFGYKHPEEQTQRPIRAIGAVWENKVPYLGISGVTPPISDGRRGLSLVELDCGWKERDAFLAVKLV